MKCSSACQVAKYELFANKEGYVHCLKGRFGECHPLEDVWLAKTISLCWWGQRCADLFGRQLLGKVGLREGEFSQKGVGGLHVEHFLICHVKTA